MANSIFRKIQKQRLRNNLIDERNTQGKGYGPSPIVIIVIIALCLSLAIAWFLNQRTGNTYSTVWEKEISRDTDAVGTFRAYEAFENGVIKYSKDGAEYIDKKGNVIWEKSYQMKSPIIDVSNNYACIADNGGNSIYIFDTKQNTGETGTALPVSKVRVSDGGVVYAVLNDSDADYITAYKPDGDELDLSVKSILTGDGYPYDISVSPDGTQMIASYLGIEGGKLKSSVIFRNFGEVGQNADAKRVVGGFSDDFANHLVGRVYFSDDEYSQAYYDGGVVFFSTKVLNSPEIIAKAEFTDEILSISCSEKLSALVTENADKTKTLHVYGTDGKLTGEAPIDYDYQKMVISGEYICFLTDSKIKAYSKKCKLRGDFDISADNSAELIGTKNSRELLIAEGNKITKIKF